MRPMRCREESIAELEKTFGQEVVGALGIEFDISTVSVEGHGVRQGI